eukprot:m.133690 g.133690  ORF g.133690 m.133690 type:complete len:361 (-) comp16518_c6_seq2:720-1802(-)
MHHTHITNNSKRFKGKVGSSQEIKKRIKQIEPKTNRTPQPSSLQPRAGGGVAVAAVRVANLPLLRRRLVPLRHREVLAAEGRGLHLRDDLVDGAVLHLVARLRPVCLARRLPAHAAELHLGPLLLLLQLQSSRILPLLVLLRPLLQIFARSLKRVRKALEAGEERRRIRAGVLAVKGDDLAEQALGLVKVLDGLLDLWRGGLHERGQDRAGGVQLELLLHGLDGPPQLRHVCLHVHQRDGRRPRHGHQLRHEAERVRVAGLNHLHNPVQQRQLAVPRLQVAQSLQRAQLEAKGPAAPPAVQIVAKGQHHLQNLLELLAGHQGVGRGDDGLGLRRHAVQRLGAGVQVDHQCQSLFQPGNAR